MSSPLARLDRSWTRLEQVLATIVIVVEIATLVFWVSLKGLAATYTPENAIGLIFRSIASAIILGSISFLLTRKRAGLASPIAVTAASIAGLFLGRVWVTAGVDWSSNVVDWLSNASSVSLIGGPRGMVTRLTLLVALLGASMAASRGKHINIDVALRFMPKKLIAPVALIGMVAAMLVCFAATFGFVDSIAVTKFRAEAFRSCETGICDTPVGERIGKIGEGMSQDFFLLRRQMSLDLSTLPKVLAGDRYDGWLDAATWNAWVREGGWEGHFAPESVASMMLPADDPNMRKMPAVVAPDTGEGRDLLIRDLNLILPWGLFIIALKFLLRIVLVLTGEVKIDVDAAHGDEELHPHEAQG